MFTWEEFEKEVPGIKDWLQKKIKKTSRCKNPKLGDTFTIIFSDKLRVQVFFFFFQIKFFEILFLK